MKDNLLVQYTAIRGTIKANVTSISMLFKQAESLKKLVSEIEDANTKKTLENQVETIEQTIGNLIKQTDELFDQYAKFVEAVFSK